jgi:hypothetical protein
MNNNKLVNLIEIYGGNEDPNIYTNSLLSKYKQKYDILIYKINNLGTLLIDSDSDNKNDKLDLQTGGKYNYNYNFKNLVF